MTRPDLVETLFKAPKPKRPQRQRQNWSAQCDLYAGRIARSRGRCEACGSRNDLQWAHGFSRSYRNTRWRDDANFCLCRGCHMRFTNRPIEWDDWLRERWGEEKYAALRALAISTDAAHKPNTKTLARELKARWEQLCADGSER